MDRETIARLREHYDTTDTSAEMEDGAWETDVDPDPMITTSVRLPKSVLDQLRARATAEGVKPTALIRKWTEERLAGGSSSGPASGSPTVEERLARLERQVVELRGQSVYPIRPNPLIQPKSPAATWAESLASELGATVYYGGISSPTGDHLMHGPHVVLDTTVVRGGLGEHVVHGGLGDVTHGDLSAPLFLLCEAKSWAKFPGLGIPHPMDKDRSPDSVDEPQRR